MAPIPNRVRELRAVTFRGEVSQKELAERVGIDPSTLSDIENQKAQPSVETALALARELGVSVENLFVPPAIPGAAMDSSVVDRNGASPTATGGPDGSVAAEPPADGIPEEQAAGNGEAEPVR